MDEQVKLDLAEMKEMLRSIYAEMVKAPARLYREEELNDLIKSDESVLMATCLWVQDVSVPNQIIATMIDTYENKMCAVVGIDAYYTIDDYYDKWVAWTDIPTNEQMDSVRWPKKSSNDYMFGGR